MLAAKSVQDAALGKTVNRFSEQSFGYEVTLHPVLLRGRLIDVSANTATEKDHLDARRLLGGSRQRSRSPPSIASCDDKVATMVKMKHGGSVTQLQFDEVPSDPGTRDRHEQQFHEILNLIDELTERNYVSRLYGGGDIVDFDRLRVDVTKDMGS